MKRKDILAILKAVKPALANKEIIEHSTSFIFKKGKVFTYNDEITISHPIPLKIKGAVPAKELYDLLNSVDFDNIKIKQKDTEILIEGEDFKAGISLTENTSIKDIKLSDKNWSKLSNKFCQGLEFCIFSAGSDYSNLVLTHIHVANGFMESTDNYRLTRFISKTIKSSMLIPVSAAKELIRYKPTHYQKTKGWIHCKNADGVVFSFRSHISKYPDTSNILKMTSPVDIDFLPALKPSLATAEVLSKEEISGDKFVKVKMKGKEMTVKGVGDVGWYKASLKLKKSYGNVSFEINSKSFRDILTHLKKASLSKTKMKFLGEDFIHVVILKGE